MPSATQIRSAIRDLRAKAGSIRCKEVTAILEGLGFDVREGSRGGHMIVTHEALSNSTEFFSTSFDCGHGSKSTVKPNYPRDLASLIARYQEDLLEHPGADLNEY